MSSHDSSKLCSGSIAATACLSSGFDFQVAKYVCAANGLTSDATVAALTPIDGHGTINAIRTSRRIRLCVPC
jgi:hypothetical protein